MSTAELRALLDEAERERVEEEAFLRKRPKVDWMIYTDRRAVSEAAVNALPALLDVADAARLALRDGKYGPLIAALEQLEATS